VSRWKYRIGVPTAVAVVAVAAAAVTPSLSSAQDPLLEPLSPTQLVAAMLGAPRQQYQGELTISSNLLGPDASLVSTLGQKVPLPQGTSTVMVYRGEGPNLRLQVLDQQSERDIYVTSQGAWVWTSMGEKALFVAPEAAGTTSGVDAQWNPTEVADRLVESLQPSSRLSLGQSTYVGGQPSYQLVLTPLTPGSTVASVQIFVDAHTYQVLGVQVRSVYSSTPVLAMMYTSFSTTAPAATVFDFTPPPGATVTRTTASALAARWDPTRAPGTTTLGHGWDAVSVVPAAAWSSFASHLSAKVLQELEQPVTVAGQTMSLVHTGLVNALVLPDGRVLVGLVRAAVLKSDAALVGG